MALMFYMPALILVLLATGGMIAFIIRQNKSVFSWSYRILIAGFSFHTMFLIHQFIETGVTPVLGMKSALGFFAWAITGAYLLFQIRFRLMVLGSFIAPLAAVLMIISATIPEPDSITISPILKSFWLTIHVVTIFAGNGIFAVMFAAAVMHLLQERQIKGKRFGFLYKRLPSLETLDSINHHALVTGFPFLTVGMVTGAVYAQQALGTYWQWDPKEVWSLITWLAYAVLLHERLAMGWRGKRAAVMAIICFVLLIFTFVGVSLLFSSYHIFGSLEGHATP